MVIPNAEVAECRIRDLLLDQSLAVWSHTESGTIFGQPTGNLSPSPRNSQAIADRRPYSSTIDLSSSREVIPEGTRGNPLRLFRDTPTQWGRRGYRQGVRA